MWCHPDVWLVALTTAASGRYAIDVRACVLCSLERARGKMMYPEIEIIGMHGMA